MVSQPAGTARCDHGRCMAALRGRCLRRTSTSFARSPRTPFARLLREACARGRCSRCTLRTDQCGGSCFAWNAHVLARCRARARWAMPPIAVLAARRGKSAWMRSARVTRAPATRAAQQERSHCLDRCGSDRCTTKRTSPSCAAARLTAAGRRPTATSISAGSPGSSTAWRRSVWRASRILRRTTRSQTCSRGRACVARPR
mmetsp:Transcript_12767/g.53685  ORF Transcript_12767/g.53685 Transcript_12767/m.53685 type:complete len:201 (+) Transcript_12767:35-637(+)